MSSSWRSIRIRAGIALPALLAFAARGWAETSGGTTDTIYPGRLENRVLLVLVVAVGLLLLIALIAKMLDLKLRRDGEVVAVRGLISDALGGDPALLGLPLTTTVRVPLWTGSPVTIRVFGEVPSDELKRIALRRVKRTAGTELAVRARIKSRISVVPIRSTPPLRTRRWG